MSPPSSFVFPFLWNYQPWCWRLYSTSHWWPTEKKVPNAYSAYSLFCNSLQLRVLIAAIGLLYRSALLFAGCELCHLTLVISESTCQYTSHPLPYQSLHEHYISWLYYIIILSGTLLLLHIHNAEHCGSEGVSDFAICTILCTLQPSRFYYNLLMKMGRVSQIRKV